MNIECKEDGPRRKYKYIPKGVSQDSESSPGSEEDALPVKGSVRSRVNQIDDLEAMIDTIKKETEQKIDGLEQAFKGTLLEPFLQKKRES
jgi:hypothetical protein